MLRSSDREERQEWVDWIRAKLIKGVQGAAAVGNVRKSDFTAYYHNQCHVTKQPFQMLPCSFPESY